MKVARDRGLKLRKARDARGLTQAQVAKLLDVSKGTVGGWEAGNHGISDALKPEVANVYGVEIADLVA